MSLLRRSARSGFAAICRRSASLGSAIPALLLALPLLCAAARAQNTTISGTVFDPRTTSDALPLPNVLVYATTAAVAPLPSGVQCLTASTPTGVVSYTNTAVDGTFTLSNIPENATYTVVIQAGKWRRQFTETVNAAPLTGLALHMPANHTEGDIPMIAVVTGSVDGVECVLLDMGIDPAEFTDDSGTVNPGGHIHFYVGSGGGGTGGGAAISSSTPSETALTENPATLNSYDMVMFPCQGSDYVKSPAALTDILNFANAGGRIFTTHYSYVWLDPAGPYDSDFPPVANWDVRQRAPEGGQATLNTNFTDGATLAQWLQNAGADYNNTPGQIELNTVRHDLDSVIAPTQSWATLNDTAYNSAIMQMTFNTPVGATAANQCGRVLFNEYHVVDLSNFRASKPWIFPNECPTGTAMTAQEEMLEYALFDLSTFEQPVVVPTLSIAFNPSPITIKEGDTSDQLSVNVTNTSSNTAIASSAILTIALPPAVTASAITDSTGGWNCTVATLTCTRSTLLEPSSSDAIAMTLAVSAYAPGAPTTGQITATVSSVTFSSNVTATDQVIFQQPPGITWATPTPIVYGTALGAAQLDAASPLAGSFVYTPPAGTILNPGQQTLGATFTPNDTADYTSATAGVTLTVQPATPAVTLTVTGNPAFATNPITFTATVPTPGSQPSAPTGSVTILDGTTPVGSATLSGATATLTTTTLAAGAHSITAVYSGDSNYATASSAPLSETIQDFTVAPANGGGSGTASNGGTVVYPLIVSPVGGSTLPAAVSLTIEGLPIAAKATFTPATVAANSGATNVMLEVELPGQGIAQPPASPFGGGAMPIAFGLVLLPFAGLRRKFIRRWHKMAVLAIAGAALAFGLSGCSHFTLSAKSFSITVTGTAGELSHSTTVQLTVQ
ncbi:MAG: Ig-like domain repeat protein [Terracidiphilus sp.]